MSTGGDNQLSTSALAKRLKLPIQQLFVTLRDYGWIDRRGKGWALTAKGELHGGQYQHSQRYGRYIVWPESLLTHPLLEAIESNQRITPGGMCRYFPHLTARQITRNFAELGLLRFTLRGVELTPLGLRFGGRQDRDDDSALLFVTWPHEIVDDPVIHRELGRLVSDGAAPQEPLAAVSRTASGPPPGITSDETPTAQGRDAAAAEGTATPDLFAHRAPPGGAASGAANASRCALDGHEVSSLLQLRVCDWLYEAQLAHARNRQLPVGEPLSADFYVPAAGLYIECWEREVPTAELTRRLRLREVCRELDLAYQEVAAADLERIDELLSTRLHKLGVDC